MRVALAALLLAGYVTGAPEWAVCANAQTASLFQEVEVRRPPKRSHTASWLSGLAGMGLIAASFPLANRADQRYHEYLAEVDVSHIDERFRDSQRADRIASGSLIAGEVLLVSGAYLRFIRPRDKSRVSIALLPSRCAVSYRF
ncbi:MAG: hypothetical protein ABIU54_04705 [Candidatus Eisenbacteria bacterium]